MFKRYQPHVDRLLCAISDSPGDLSAALRESIIARGKSQVHETNLSGDSVPPELTEFVDKITYMSHDIRDSDIDALHAAGYSDEAIVEIIRCAALAAGLGRLEVAAAAMQGKAAMR